MNDLVWLRLSVGGVRLDLHATVQADAALASGELRLRTLPLRLPEASLAALRGVEGVTLNNAWAAGVTAGSSALWALLLGGDDDDDRPGFVERLGRALLRNFAGMVYGGDLAADLAGVVVDRVRGRRVWLDRATTRGPLLELIAGVFRTVDSLVKAATSEGVVTSGPRRGRSRRVVALLDALDSGSLTVLDALGVPSRPIRGTVKGAWSAWKRAKGTPAGERAYERTRRAVSDFLAARGRTRRTEALVRVRSALRASDVELLTAAIAEYYLLGGSPRRLLDSLASMEPLGGLSRAEGEEFIAGLTPRQREDLRAAQRWFERVLLQNGEMLRSAMEEAGVRADRELRRREASQTPR